MKIDKYGWQFSLDVQKTQLMYRHRLKSIIDAHKQFPELVNFLNELGIDIEKPDRYHPGFSDVIYTFIGSAKSETNYEIDMYGKEQFISVVVYDKNGSVMLEVFGMK
ncbi:hypothetical protein [Clostridium sp. HMP27]|uniref:hypothetical protein n=1 Tax=Clostridium sp. HMP27 TaxID=1487921 RepID=UPI00052DEF6C|nr:hypothetical protein [Clostridium sp. HMP27]KGK90129.1 hypothetical protein DP68_01520 [Clostridium sp. HMP27]